MGGEEADLEGGALVVSLFLMLVCLGFLFAGWMVEIRRWQDMDKPGYYVLINLIPCVGGVYALVSCGFVRGTIGANQFGPDPLNLPSDVEVFLEE